MMHLPTHNTAATTTNTTPAPCTRRTMVLLATAILAISWLTLATPWAASAADINSNGLGGGMWNDTATWRGNQIPKPEDDVTIARGDVVTFDRNDQDKASCNKLFIDPNGSLAFKSGAGHITMIVADAIESYGSIKIDAARVHGDVIELRMTGELQPQRTLTLIRGGSLSVAGKKFLDPKDASAILSAHPGKDGFTQTSPTMLITTDGNTAIDLHNTRLDGVSVRAVGLDNTGAEPGQRLNVIGNYFQGMSAVVMVSCDTPILADNSFINTHPSGVSLIPINIANSALPVIRNNVIKGNISRGIFCTSLTDPLIQNNHVEGAGQGYLIQYCNNTMMQGNKAINCKVGFFLRLRSGVMRDSVTDNCELPIQSVVSNQQLISNSIINPVKDKPYLSMQSSTAILFNTQIQPDSVVSVETKRGNVLIAHQPLIVRVKGKVPADCEIEVTPTNKEMALKQQYPPVVNSPASLDRNGLTPTMITGRAIMVRSWEMINDDDDNAKTGKKPVLPTYQIRVLGPQPAGGKGERPTLATRTVTPDASWYRADLGDASPMVEINLP